MKRSSTFKLEFTTTDRNYTRYIKENDKGREKSTKELKVRFYKPQIVSSIIFSLALSREEEDGEVQGIHFAHMYVCLLVPFLTAYLFLLSSRLFLHQTWGWFLISSRPQLQILSKLLKRGDEVKVWGYVWTVTHPSLYFHSLIFRSSIPFPKNNGLHVMAQAE